MSQDRNRDDRGRYVETLTTDRVLAFLRRAGEPVTAREVGDEFGVTNRAALNKLDQLHDQGDIERKEVGARAIVWWVETATTDETDVGDIEDDPLFDLPTAASGRSDVSENVDEHLADALAGEE